MRLPVYNKVNFVSVLTRSPLAQAVKRITDLVVEAETVVVVPPEDSEEHTGTRLGERAPKQLVLSLVGC